jgi:hypothetical protein
MSESYATTFFQRKTVGSKSRIRDETPGRNQIKPKFNFNKLLNGPKWLIFLTRSELTLTYFLSRIHLAPIDFIFTIFPLPQPLKSAADKCKQTA